MTTVTVYCARPGDYRVSIDDGDGQIIDLAPWPMRRHAESHARRIRAALDWRPGDGDPWAAHVAAQDERIARLKAENAELRGEALNVFGDHVEWEVADLPPSIRDVWRRGKTVSEVKKR